MTSKFASFKQSFKGDIYTPTDAGYLEALTRWALNAQVNAQIVAFVKDPEDVALAIAYAKQNDLPIAIRGGGHSTAGASSTEGLVIDLSRHLNTVEIDAENKLAYVGGGAIWEQVDKATIQHGLASVAGTVNHVCHQAFDLPFKLFLITSLESPDWSRRVWILYLAFAIQFFIATLETRLTLGGGMGYLSGEHGLVIDNLLKVGFLAKSSRICLYIPTRLQLSPVMGLS